MPSTILLAGDTILDHYVYEGQQRLAGSLRRVGTLHVPTLGGTSHLLDLLKCYGSVRKGTNSNGGRELEAVAGFKPPDLSEQKHLHACSLSALFPAGDVKSEKVWRIRESLGYGGRASGAFFCPTPDGAAWKQAAFAWLLDDGGLDFRDRRSAPAWPPALRNEGTALPEWIVLKSAGPLASGDLWQTLRHAQFGDAGLACGPLLDRTIVVVSAEDIRYEQVQISHGLSWERTALEFATALREMPTLRQLAACRYVIVMFGVEGAILVAESPAGDLGTHLLFDPANQEGDWTSRIEGGVDGRLCSFVAGLVSRLPDRRTEKVTVEEIARLLEGMGAGLCAVRRLHLRGHGSDPETPRLPLTEIAAEILEPTSCFEHVAVPRNVCPGLVPCGPPFIASTALDSGSTPSSDVIWRILEGDPCSAFQRCGLTSGQSRLVAQFGLKKLSGVPYLAVGALKTVDRGEIESLRGLKRLIEDYQCNTKAKRPLSIGVFGQPGAGKSFGVKQIAKATLPDSPILEFNLSQLSESDESVLVGAFHQVRDRVLEGKTPVVFWDEFDAKQMRWLANLLAPMQDGTFLEGQMTHPVGKCIFVFAGGTSYDFASFGPPDLSDVEVAALSDENKRRLKGEHLLFRAKKGPDFKSRLTAYLNVAGPNHRKNRNWREERYDVDASDSGYPLRRALLLRSQLGLKDDQLLDIDPGLLTALLEVDEYRHGARSMEKIVEQLQARSGGGRLRLSHLPPDEIVALHVDPIAFRQLLDRDLEFQRQAEAIAPYIHDAFVRHANRSGRPLKDQVNRQFNTLAVEYQEDNIAAARRMPSVLAVAGLLLVKGTNVSAAEAKAVAERIETQVDIMAEAEHIGWMEHKWRNQWECAPVRDDAAKKHPCLQAFSLLSAAEREKDRAQVRLYPALVEHTDYCIVRQESVG
jgi:hypothetical protein